jgi:nucleoside-diphosphate-sugar epimerase
MAILNTLILLKSTSRPTTIKRKVLLPFYGNNSHANVTKCNVTRTLSILFSPQVFSKHGPESKSKVVAICGDISQPGLALSEEDRRVLTDKVSVVFHAAATINFNASLQSAINTNLVGTKRILQLCHHMPKIKVRIFACV